MYWILFNPRKLNRGEIQKMQCKKCTTHFHALKIILYYKYYYKYRNKKQ